MKKLYIILLSMVLLIGCEHEKLKPYGIFENVKVKDVKAEEHCFRGCYSDYSIQFEKNGTVVELTTTDDGMFNVLKKGNIVTVSYDKDYNITDIKFPNLEKGIDTSNK